ncbi:MAG: chromosome segregation protein SMC [Verrucomicrobia bacterium]|nr:chromosome segregation protein SMC [Verrucomicrobiota bacterium]
MHLKSLELHGFKSFAERTLFEFHEGVTGIVGPNGCGKSNVVDAVRWVLGETSAKALRGGEMADVIFNGTDKRKPLGMAEVTLTMAGCEGTLKMDYDEVSITRRVFRDGKSEYRINGTLCRLRDIHELFMDTGIGRSAYSIMEQGKIDMLLSAKPEDRRQVFEEAAGITKFKKEKKEALRKLEYTEANLLRISDVLAEQERRINSLKRQVSKARRYQTLAKDVKGLDTHLSHRRYVENAAERDELRTSLDAFSVQRGDLEELLPEREQAVVDARDKAQNLEAELSALRQELSTHQTAVHAAESRIQFNRERCEELRMRIKANEDEVAVTEQKQAQQEFDFNESQSELEGVLKRIAEQEAGLRGREEEVTALAAQGQELARRLHQVREEAKRTEAAMASGMAKVESAEAQAESSRDRLRHLGDEEEVLSGELAEMKQIDGDLAKQIEEAEGRTPVLAEAVQGAERAFQHARGDLDAAQQRRVELDRNLSSRQSRLDILRQLLARGEGLQEGTQKVLAGLDDPALFQPGLRGMLGNHLKVKPCFEPAVEAALGANLEAVIVRDADLADAILDRLTGARLGQVALITTEWLRPTGGRQLETVPEGAECWAADCVEVEADLNPVVERLLDRVLVVSDRARALALRVELPELIYVTRQGEVLRPEGVLAGGAVSGEEGTSMLQRQNEVADLELEVNALAGLIREADSVLLTLKEQAEQRREEVEQSKDRQQRHLIEMSTLEGQHSLASRECKSLESKLANVTWEREEIRGRDESASQVRHELQVQLETARERSAALEIEIRELQAQLDEANRRENEKGAELNEVRTALAVERRAREAAEQQQGPMESRISELRELNARRTMETEQFEMRIAGALEEDAQLLVNIDENLGEVRRLEAVLQETSGRRTELLAAIKGAETALSDVRHRVDGLNERRSKEEVSHAKVEMRIEKMLETVMERYQVDLTIFEPDPHELLICIADQKGAFRKQEKRQATIELAQAEGEEGGERGDSGEDEQEESMSVAETVEAEMEDMSDEDGPDWDFVEYAVGQLRRRLDSMGPVNLDAIEEYDELEALFTYNRNQHDDLVNAKVKLLEVIELINIDTTKRFAETFEKVQRNFREMFRELFGDGAKADLILLDDGDPLDCGIEVIAKPPGKKLQSISLLSGGERSMTAVALLFSIYMVKPSPFCILDELDAPLDESNIGRFLKVLDRFIDQSQFIIVTHSKRTMARADVMYGVTMEEFGVSKPVGMRLTHTESKKPATSAAGKAAERLDAE